MHNYSVHHLSDQDSIVDIDPQTVCGYNPCRVAKCILLPYATCVSDFKCRPVFFDSEERKVSQCTGNILLVSSFEFKDDEELS